jgi:hypothetical protein
MKLIVGIAIGFVIACYIAVKAYQRFKPVAEQVTDKVDSGIAAAKDIVDAAKQPDQKSQS